MRVILKTDEAMALVDHIERFLEVRGEPDEEEFLVMVQHLDMVVYMLKTILADAGVEVDIVEPVGNPFFSPDGEVL